MVPKERIVCAMSGGVDSSVAAALLVRQGFDVVGLYMRNGIEAGDAARRGKQGCCSLEDSMDARRVADALGIPFYVLNLAQEFEAIITGFLDEYDRGRTPNPCIQCNRRLKFGRLLDYANSLGASSVATGHYARVRRSGDRLAISRAADLSKDQSYVLFPLEQDALARCRFPLGEMTKDSVRELARDMGLRVFDKPDSQEICFVPGGDYRALVRERRPENLGAGDIVDEQGNVLGRHEGYQLFTIGQRRGFGRSFGRPVYVLDIDPHSHRVTVGDFDALLSGGLTLNAPVYQGHAPLAAGEVLEGTVKVRYRHDPSPARAVGRDGGGIDVRFLTPVRAVTPGQAAVFYRDGAVAFGGYIDAVLGRDAVAS